MAIPVSIQLHSNIRGGKCQMATSFSYVAYSINSIKASSPSADIWRPWAAMRAMKVDAWVGVDSALQCAGVGVDSALQCVGVGVDSALQCEACHQGETPCSCRGFGAFLKGVRVGFRVRVGVRVRVRGQG